MMKFYSGIGPRATPRDVQDVMTDIAKQLVPTGWCLRSGFANGADRAFGRGAIRQQIFLPWEGYNGGYSNGVDKAVIAVTSKQVEIARRSYQADPEAVMKPAWDDLHPAVMQLLCRNVPIILGENLDDPSECVITWSPRAQIIGGTGHAVRIASLYGIPTFNICIREEQNALCKFILNSENRSVQVAA